MRKNPRPTQDHKPGVVPDQVQPPVAQLPLPADPAVPMPALERPRLPAGEREPLPPPLDNVAQSPSRKPLEAEIVVLIDRLVPSHPFLRARETHLRLFQRIPFRPDLEDRWRLHWFTPEPKHAASEAKKPVKTPKPRPLLQLVVMLC